MAHVKESVKIDLKVLVVNKWQVSNGIEIKKRFKFMMMRRLYTNRIKESEAFNKDNYLADLNSIETATLFSGPSSGAAAAA